MYAHKPSLEPLLTELAHFLDGNDLTQVRQIVDEIQVRISRFEERK